jgi:phosphoribosylglycinamide formyltransferase 1
VAFRLAVLVSGAGTNLQAILDTVHGREGIEVVGVASSAPDAHALERARRAGVESAVFAISDYAGRAARDRALGDWLEARGVDLVVLAGFMEILGGEFIGRFHGRIINIHPSLLPAFPGVDAIRKALEHGAKVLGATVHFVDEGVDSGPIILQEPLELSYPRDLDEVEERVHAIEHRLLPRAVRLIAAGAVRTDRDNPRLVWIEDGQGG